ncbi:MAG: Fibronectin type III domain protein [Parcubacteria group bacterium GW2011_GWB1_41_5]|nr:MAG: Fibronectin type III domain protein [Parcubacteria group bacterium GW2011_GWB1_41_5]
MPRTTYYFRAYATNATTTGYGEILNFSTTQPDTVPGSPTGVSAVAGNQQATVSFSAPASDGGSTILYYTASSSPGHIAGYGSGSPITVTGLTNEVAYTFTVTATNAIGTSTPSTASNEVTPNTTDPPTVTTSATVDPIGQLSATLNGDITATGGQNATQHGFAYGTSATLVTVIATTTGGAFSGTGAFTSSSARSISSLSCGTTYYYRAYASNDYGTGYGTIQNFETLACAESVPTVIVLAYDTVTQTSANLLTFT